MQLVRVINHKHIYLFIYEFYRFVTLHFILTKENIWISHFSKICEIFSKWNPSLDTKNLRSLLYTLNFFYLVLNVIVPSNCWNLFKMEQISWNWKKKSRSQYFTTLDNLSLLFSDVESYNTIPWHGIIHNTLFHKLFVCF